MEKYRQAYKEYMMSDEWRRKREEMKTKYMQVSDTLFNLFMTEHNNIGSMFKEE